MQTMKRRELKEEMGEILTPQDIKKMYKEENIKDGDYVYAPQMSGVYYRGGIILDMSGDETDLEQWTSHEIRESLAKSCVMKLRKISSTNYFSKGKLNELGQYLKS